MILAIKTWFKFNEKYKNEPEKIQPYIDYKKERIASAHRKKMKIKLGISRSRIDRALEDMKTKEPKEVWKELSNEMFKHHRTMVLKFIMSSYVFFSSSCASLMSMGASIAASAVSNFWFMYDDFAKGSALYGKKYIPGKHDRLVLGFCTLVALSTVGTVLAFSIISGGTFPLVIGVFAVVAMCSYSTYMWHHQIKASKAYHALPDDKKYKPKDKPRTFDAYLKAHPIDSKPPTYPGLSVDSSSINNGGSFENGLSKSGMTERGHQEVGESHLVSDHEPNEMDELPGSFCYDDSTQKTS